VLEIIKWLSSHPDSSAEDALGELKLGMLTNEELSGIISKALESNRSLVHENGTKAMGKMMNLVMGEVRGRADPKMVTELLRTQLEQFKGRHLRSTKPQKNLQASSWTNSTGRFSKPT